MNNPKPPLTIEMLERIALELSENKIPVERDSKGNPVYSLKFHGTHKELRQLRRKLKFLE